MKKCTVAAALAVVLVAFRSSVSAQPLSSGPQVGQKVPGPFFPLHVNGPEAGNKSCLYCKNGANPVAMIFAREVSPNLVMLVKKIDAVTAAHSDCHMGSFITFLSDAPQLSEALKQLADREHIQSTILCTYAPAGPSSYKIAADADVTVILYTHHTVKANYALRKGELTPQVVDAVVADVAKILPTE